MGRNVSCTVIQNAIHVLKQLLCNRWRIDENDFVLHKIFIVEFTLQLTWNIRENKFWLEICAIRIPEFRHPNVSVPWLGMRNKAYMITNALTHDCGILNSREWMATNVTEWWHRKMHVNRSSLIVSTNTLVYQVREGTQILKLTYQRCSYKLRDSDIEIDLSEMFL